ncbi:ribosome assembly protein 1 [[Candida] railenensis]|uniref:Ribosome assembly protein 1 n=1 Tax=[Candida] railenensis TaxID=45579 RepID=A0A9P0QN96_9ASCO|nr:ribosome assembly protein 1 [[Candida] railenensis]
MRLSAETITSLQSDPDCIRNICILAHVDHGKTSLSDSLLATNGIISQRMAGKVRYLDSREDEQLRGITMEASAISLYFKVMKQLQGEDSPTTKEYLINLIDSPGHIDFSSEVSTASRLCDGAVVVVDVIEGVCSQTVNVLRQCWVDKLKPILVLNKIDRLFIEWKLTPLEAYQQLSRVIEQVNSVIGALYSGDRMEDDLNWRESGLNPEEYVEKSDQDIYFSPELNNVVFASAADGWGFSVNTFAKIYAAKLGFSHKILTKTLWGDFYLDMKNKKILPGKKVKVKNYKPIFVSLVMDQIWALYENCVIDRNQEKLESIIGKLGAKVSPRDLRSKEYKSLLNVIMSQWIPLSHALLGSVIDKLPSPAESQSDRMDKILSESLGDERSKISTELDESLHKCQSSNPDLNTVAYISKMVSVPQDELPKDIITGSGENASVLSPEELAERSRRARELARKASEAAAVLSDEKRSNDDQFKVVTGDEKSAFEWEVEDDDFEAFHQDSEDDEPSIPETLIAFTRIFSGSLAKGQTVTVISPKYDPSNSQQDQIIKDVEIKDLYLIMGREFVRMETVPAGNIVGVVGLGGLSLKNATICSKDQVEPYINFASTSTLIHNKPIMKLAIEPTNPMKLEKLEEGLTKLALADPVLEWYTDDDSGELIMCVAGELHLERCLKDLEERFAKGCEVVVKEPVIPFREGITGEDEEVAKELVHDDSDEEDYDEEGEEDEDDRVVGGVELSFQLYSLPPKIVKFLNKNEQLLYDIVHKKDGDLKILKNELVSAFKNESEEDDDEKITAFLKLISSQLKINSVEELINQIICFGPKRVGANMLIEPAQENRFGRFFNPDGSADNRFTYANNVINGFQLSTNEGPLASEQLIGTLVVVKVQEHEIDEDDIPINISGRLITMTRDMIHEQFLTKGPRLYLAMYTCDIQASAEVLGKVYGVVQQRGGTIISEEMKEGTPFFTIEARIPVIEAFGFSEDIRKKTSGAASPQLVFDGFDILDLNPYWVPHTEEELEELGEFAERENVARKYMNGIRRRKGLFIDEKVVQNAEKQRTLKKD